MEKSYPIWKKYLLSLGETPETTSKKIILADHFCNDKESADYLYELALTGIKRATTGSTWVYDYYKESILKPNDLSILTNFDGTKMCILKTIKVTIKKFSEITSTDAQIEGEGDKTLEYWRKVHKEYFEEECNKIGKTFSENMNVVFEEFCVEYKE